MSEFATRLDAMRVRVVSPNGSIEAVLSGRSELRLTFIDDYYERADERDLERQAEGLCRLLWAGRHREFEDVVEAFGGHIAEASDDPGESELQDALTSMRFEGTSADGRVRVVATAGMRQWEVHIADGTLAALGPEAFSAAAGQAAAGLFADQTAQLIQATGE